MITRLVAWLLLTAAGVFALAAPASAAPPELQADYRFHDRLTSSVPGAPPLQNLNIDGTNTFATENVDGNARRVLRFPEGNGLRLNHDDVVRPTRYTIAVRFRFDAVTGYRRVIAFKPNEAPQVDTGVYVHDGSFVFYDRRLPDDQVIDADEWVTVVVTRAANDVVRGYVDGVQQFSFVDDQNRAAIQRFLRFFKDDPNDEESSGAVARIRIWDGPLTPAQVAGLGQ